MAEAEFEQVDDFGEEVWERFKKSRNHSRDWRNEAKENYDYNAGHQWTDDEVAYLEEQMRPAVTFNRIGPMIESVVGHQIQNRQEIRYFQREQGDAQVSEILTGASQWVDDECDAEDEITDAFSDLLIAGMGWGEVRLSYDEDPDGKIHSAERIHPIEMYWDPSAKKRNLSDARYLIRAKWMPRDEAEQRWPKIKDLEMKEETMWEEETGTEPHDAARAFLYENNSSEWYKPHTGEVFILQYQYWEHEPIYRIGDPTSGRLIELSEKKFNRLKDRIEMMGMRYIRQLKKKYKQAFLVGKETLEDGDCPCPHSFTLRAMTGKRDANRNTWYGLVRGMKDPQSWSNKFFSEIQDILMSNRQGGAYVEENALVDPQKAEEIWADSNPLIMVRDGALSGNKIQDRSPIPYPNGLDRLMGFAVQSIPDVSGINLEMMGLVDRDQAGVLEAQRKRAGMTILSTLFDALRRFQKERGRVVLYFIQEYISDERLIKIIGEGGQAKYVPLVKQPDTARYDLIVDESPTSTNQKQETFAVLQAIMPSVMQAGIPIPPEIIDYIPIPPSFGEKWKAFLAQQQQNPEQEKMQAAELDKTQAQAHKDHTAAELNTAKAEEIRQDTELAPVEQISNMIDRGSK